MKSTRILLVTIGGAVSAVLVALVWRRAPEPIDITTSTMSSPKLRDTSSGAHATTELSPVTPAVSDDRSPPQSLEAEENVSTPSVPREQLWAQKYAGLDAKQLRERSKQFLSDLVTRSRPELEELYETGVYEVVSETNKYTFEPKDNDSNGVTHVVILPVNSEHPTGETRRTILPESRYPDLWALQDEYNWMRRRADELTSHSAGAVADGSATSH